MKQVIWMGKLNELTMVICTVEIHAISFFNSEVNLKIKQALPETASYLSPLDLKRFSGSIQCEQPNNRLYNYDGTLHLNLADGKQRSFPLDPSKLLLRGAQLRNTSWIYGIVVFTGHETKLMLNSR